MQDGVLKVFNEHSSMLDPRVPDKMLLLFSGDYVKGLDYNAMRERCTLIPVQS